MAGFILVSPQLFMWLVETENALKDADASCTEVAIQRMVILVVGHLLLSHVVDYVSVGDILSIGHTQINVQLQRWSCQLPLCQLCDPCLQSVGTTLLPF